MDRPSSDPDTICLYLQALATIPMSSGKHTWKVTVKSETPHNLSTFIGIAKKPIRSYYYNSTEDLWLYSGYSGSLYHSGKNKLRLARYDVGDTIQVTLNLNTGTLSFAKNGEDLGVAFTDLKGVFYAGKDGGSFGLSASLRLGFIGKIETLTLILTGLIPSLAVVMNDYQRQVIEIHDYHTDNGSAQAAKGPPVCAVAQIAVAEEIRSTLGHLARAPLWQQSVFECLSERFKYVSAAAFQRAVGHSPDHISCFLGGSWHIPFRLL